MPAKSSSTVFGMSFKKNPRNGQMGVFNEILENRGRLALNVQLPTGYGKSFVNAGIYSILKKQNRVNRLLIIVPTVAQKTQFVSDGPFDFEDACVDGPLGVIDVSYFEKNAVGRHRKNENQIFVVTAQALLGIGGVHIRDMMQTGSWMVTVDEYHHYGLEKSWGEAVKSLPHAFLLAMSATPYRKDDDSAFGAPDFIVSYRQAEKEKAVKPLKGHSYKYRLDLLDKDNNIIHMTTDEFINAVGSASPDKIEKFKLERSMRWSPKYVSPLVAYPIERMIRQRMDTGHKLQAIVGAMCVSHAKLVCEQLKSMFPELAIDWVGTGIDGRDDNINRKIIHSFCPKKGTTPTLDILVHVGMAGEGLDSVNVSEVVHLNKASLNNSNNQENGRAARYIDGVVGNINFDSSSDYSSKGYIGSKIMDAMDFMPPSDKEEDQEDAKEESPFGEELGGLLPDEPKIKIWNLELENIDSGSPEVQRMADIMIDYYKLEKDIADKDSSFMNYACEAYKNMRMVEAEKHNDQALVEQHHENLKNAVSTVAGKAMRLKIAKGTTFQKSLKGDILRAINTKKKYYEGEVKKDIATLKRHYAWICELDKTITNTGLPSWLA